MKKKAAKIFTAFIMTAIIAQGTVMVAILDETDSGLDVDAVRTVSEGVHLYREKVHGSLLIITHSTRILEALHVDETHVMENGVIVKNGGAELIKEINENGFGAIKTDNRT